VRAFLAAAVANDDDDMTPQACRHAGETVALAALINEYRSQLHLLKELDPDAAFRWAAALALCLSEPVEARP
jgi:hypothetical protein